jgi:hypothetical protein
MDRSAGERVERYSGRVVGRRIIYYQFKEGVQGWMSQGSVEKAGLACRRWFAAVCADRKVLPPPGSMSVNACLHQPSPRHIHSFALTTRNI